MTALSNHIKREKEKRREELILVEANPKYQRKSKRGCHSDDGLAWVTVALPISLPLLIAVEGGGTSFGATSSFLLMVNIDPRANIII